MILRRRDLRNCRYDIDMGNAFFMHSVQRTYNKPMFSDLLRVQSHQRGGSATSGSKRFERLKLEF
jgi:hypothetical protein